MSAKSRGTAKPAITPSDLPIPAAFFSTRRLLECNTLFEELFLPVGEGESGGLTLAAFAGDENPAFAKELARIAGTTEPMRTPVVREILLPTREGPRRFLLSALPAPHGDKRAVRVVVQDVTAYSDRARHAEEAERRYRLYVESTAAAIALVRNGVFVYVNKGLLDLFGFMFAEEVLAKDVAAFFSARDRKSITDHAHVAEGSFNPATVLECTAIRKDRTRLYLQIRTEVIDDDGQQTLLWHCTDISHLREAEEAVEEKARENEILEHLLAAVHQSVEKPDVQRAALSASLKWLGYETGGVFLTGDDGKTLLLETEERLPPALADKLHELPAHEGLMGFLTKTMEPVRLTIEEYPAHLPYRALFEAENFRALAFLPLVSGEMLAGVMMLLTTKTQDVPAYHQGFLDVVARHLGHALQKAVVYGGIQRRADALQDAIEQVPGAIYVAAANGAIRYLSPVVERLTGYKTRELTASPDAWRAIVHPDDRSIAAGRISRQADPDNEFALEYRILPKGKAAYCRVRDAVRYIRAADGSVQSIYGLLTDITAQKAVEANAMLEDLRTELEAAPDRESVIHALCARLALQLGGELRLAGSIATLFATALDRYSPRGESESEPQMPAGSVLTPDEFTHIVSHDLKEPLITIAGYATLALDGGSGLDEEVRDNLNAVLRSSTRMRQLVDDLLTLLRVGYARVHRTAVSPAAVLDGLLCDLEFLLKERHARVEYPQDLPQVHSDPTMLGIVFRNLIVNGIRHNSQDAPLVTIASLTGPDAVTFSVSDNGVGIAAEDSGRIFDLFERLHAAAGRPGTGVGLAIVRRIVEALGGTVWVESTPEIGSTFSFTVPIHE